MISIINRENHQFLSTYVDFNAATTSKKGTRDSVIILILILFKHNEIPIVQWRIEIKGSVSDHCSLKCSVYRAELTLLKTPGRTVIQNA